MPRKRVVTRTITTTDSEVMYVSISTGETFKENIIVAGYFTDDDKLLKKVQHIEKRENVRPVAILSKQICKTRYAMAEQDFIEQAYIYPELKELRR